MILPAYPIAGQGIRAEWGRQLVDYLRSITPRPSASVRVNTGPGGTVLSVSVKDGADEAPFSELRKPWLYDQSTGAILLGNVYIGGVPKTVIDWPTDGDLGDVEDTTVYWIKIDFQNATATFESGATLPANTSDLDHWHILTLTCTDGSITGIWQPWTCDIRALLNP